MGRENFRTGRENLRRPRPGDMEIIRPSANPVNGIGKYFTPIEHGIEHTLKGINGPKNTLKLP